MMIFKLLALIRVLVNQHHIASCVVVVVVVVVIIMLSIIFNKTTSTFLHTLTILNPLDPLVFERSITSV